MTRNNFLKTLGLGFSSTLLASCMDWMNMTPKPRNILDGEFLNALKIPENVSGTTVLSAQTREDILLENGKVNVLGYRNGLLGPTIRVQKGGLVNIPFQNKMKEHTNVHWHGLVIPPEMDGHPDAMVMPNENFNFKFTVNQQAGTNWYHPHIHEHTGEQVTKGLSGLFIVESPDEKALNLPSGNYEIPLIIQDKRFNSDGTIRYNPNMKEVMGGFMGDNILVNGTMKPYLEVSTRFYRFRLLNGSSARIYNLALSNSADFYLIGSDGCIFPQPEKVKNLLLASGERADILVDFTNNKLGEKVYLLNQTFSTMGEAQGYQEFKIISFNVNLQESDSFKIPSSLIPFTKLSNSSKTRKFSLKMGKMNMKGGMHKINGKVYSASRIDETVAFGATEIWEFDNSTGDEPHPMHIHGVQFQLVSRTGGRNLILPQEKAWKDTILVAPGENVQVIMKFEQEGKFVFHCHNLEHEDDGMMLNFEVK